MKNYKLEWYRVSKTEIKCDSLETQNVNDNFAIIHSDTYDLYVDDELLWSFYKINSAKKVANLLRNG